MSRINVVANPRQSFRTVKPTVHGHFAEQLSRCITNGAWDSNNNRWQPDLIKYLKMLGPELIRWPGGCFADMYHWQDGIGVSRPKRVTSRWGWDEIETNEVGTHEFLGLCEETGAQAWINGNVANGTAQEMVDWVEYCCFDGETELTSIRRTNGRQEPWNVPYWGIGNECWDCGGKFTPKEYAEAYRRYESSLPRFQRQPLYLVVCGPDGNKPHERAAWTRQTLARLHEWRQPRIHAVDAHFYFWGDEKGTGTSQNFDNTQYIELIRRALEIEPMMREQIEIIDEFNPNIQLIIGEYGSWHPDAWQNRFWQPVTMRDALAIAVTLDVFHRLAKRVDSAALTMLCNVLASPFHVIDGQVIPTPVYYTMLMFKEHRGGESIAIDPIVERTGTIQTLSASITKHEDGWVITLTNLDPEQSQTVNLEGIPNQNFRGMILRGDSLQAENTPQNPHRVGIAEFKVQSELVLPPASIVTLSSRGVQQ